MDMDFVYDASRDAFVPKQQKLLGGDVDPNYGASTAPGKRGFRQYVTDAWDGTKASAGKAWTGANESVAGGIKGVPGTVSKVWGSGPVGKAGVIAAGGAGLYALGRGVVYPLLSGTGAISDKQQEQIARSGFGRAMTGEPQYDAGRSQAVMEQMKEEYADEVYKRNLEEQERLKLAFQEDAAFRSQLGFENAQKYGRLGLDLGTVATFRDVYAGQLANSTANYLTNMRIANEGIRDILNPQVQVI